MHRRSRIKDFRNNLTIPASLLVIPLLLLTAQRVDASDTDLQSAAGRVTQIIAHRGASAERPECTLSAVRRAIQVGATAVEIDVRTSKDGELYILHDATLDRTTNGRGVASELTLDEIQKLDAGSWFDPSYRGQRVPSLIEVANECRGRIDLLLDLKEQGDQYDRNVVEVIRRHGDPAKTIVGVRSVAQAERFRRLLPTSRQLALIPSVESIEAFARAGVDTIRLWPKWLEENDDAARRVRAVGKQLHLNGTLGEIQETRELLVFEPDSLSSDHPARLQETLKRIVRGDNPATRMESLITPSHGPRLVVDESQLESLTFLNRDYRMLELPPELQGMPRYCFDGGIGDQVRLTFRRASVVFAVFEYNDTGSWSFQDNRPPEDFGWHLWRKDSYCGSSNSPKNGDVHRASIWFREFRAGQELVGLPNWWLCLGITDLEAALKIYDFRSGLTSDLSPARVYSHAEQAAQTRPLMVPDFDSVVAFHRWQEQQRKRFIDRMLYRYDGQITVSKGPESIHGTHRRQEFHIRLDGHRLFRFFRLEPTEIDANRKLPTIACFMGHGKVAQLLDEEESYQHAGASRFADAGYLVYAMENIGMEPGRDTHLDLDQSLRLEGHGWYSLLFAHQRMMLNHILADSRADEQRIAATGVSTGGLLALSAAVIEPAIAVASVHGIFGSMRVSFIRDRHRHCKCGAIPGLLPEFDLPELALLVAPRVLHVSNGKDDGFSPTEAKRVLELLEPQYRKFGFPRPLMNVSPGGHEYYFGQALKFFEGSLTPP